MLWRSEAVARKGEGGLRVHHRVIELLGRCGSETSVLPPTQLFNEGWLLRLALDWFDRHRPQSHPLSFLPGARWYSEALLPSRFLPRYRGDERAESFTHADGVIGHFSITPGARGEARLLPNAKQFVVVEAKLGSSLSSGTKNAPDYDQAARNVGCMVHMLETAQIDVAAVERLAFIVVAPETQIRAGVFGKLVTIESIAQKITARVNQYGGHWDAWLFSTCHTALECIDLVVLSWESILSNLPEDEEGVSIRDFYAHCLRFNPSRT